MPNGLHAGGRAGDGAPGLVDSLLFTTNPARRRARNPAVHPILQMRLTRRARNHAVAKTGEEAVHGAENFSRTQCWRIPLARICGGGGDLEYADGRERA